jgi:hypothetical protein
MDDKTVITTARRARRTPFITAFMSGLNSILLKQFDDHFYIQGKRRI